MEIEEIIGIDVSKLTLDCCIHSNGQQIVIDNTPESIVKMAAWSIGHGRGDKGSTIFIFEHTGLYTHRLVQVLGENDYMFRLVPGLEIKRSLGMTRGKDDKSDAKRIALYGYRLRGELAPSKKIDGTMDSLKRLMSLRKKLVRQRAGYITCVGEQKRVLSGFKGSLLDGAQREIIYALDKQINRIEAELEKIITEHPKLQRLYRLLVTIKGIGPVTARFLIVHTAGFTGFESWRKFASYSGIAPFPNRSGTSVRGRTKTSNLANKEAKTLLNLCAFTAIQWNPEMRAYYNRRIGEGKSKMGTMNIIRNKILARAFAVAKRGTPYVDTMKYAS